MKGPIHAAALLFVATTGSYAALLSEDHFLIGPTPAAGEYVSGQITGQSPTVFGYTGNWLNGNTLTTATTSGLTYPGLQSSGGAVLGMSGGSRAGRLLSSPFTASTNGTFYLSVLIDLSNASGGNYKAFELHNGGFSDGTNRVLQIGQGGTGTDFNGTTNFGLRLFSNDSFRIDLGTADTETNLFVVRFNLSSTNNGDSITVYRNPALDAEPAIALGTLSNFNLAFDRTSVAAFQSTGDSLTVDEIRIGNNYSDVLPAIPEPSAVLGICAASILSMTVRRRAA